MNATRRLKILTARFDEYLRSKGVAVYRGKAVEKRGENFWWDTDKQQRVADPSKQEEPTEERQPAREEPEGQGRGPGEDQGQEEVRDIEPLSEEQYEDLQSDKRRLWTLQETLADSAAAGDPDVLKLAEELIGLDDASQFSPRELKKMVKERLQQIGWELEAHHEAAQRRQGQETVQNITQAAKTDPKTQALLSAASQLWQEAKEAWGWVGSVISKVADAVSSFLVVGAHRALDWVNKKIGQLQGKGKPVGPKGRPDEFKFKNTIWAQTGKTVTRDGREWSEYEDLRGGIKHKLVMDDDGVMDGDIYFYVSVGDLLGWTQDAAVNAMGAASGQTGEAAEDAMSDATGLPAKPIMGLMGRLGVLIWDLKQRALGRETTAQKHQREAEEASKKRKESRRPRGGPAPAPAPVGSGLDEGAPKTRGKSLPDDAGASAGTDIDPAQIRPLKRQATVYMLHSLLEEGFKAAGGRGFPKEVVEQAVDAWLDGEDQTAAEEDAGKPGAIPPAPEVEPSYMHDRASSKRFDAYLKKCGRCVKRTTKGVTITARE